MSEQEKLIELLQKEIELLKEQIALAQKKNAEQTEKLSVLSRPKERLSVAGTEDHGTADESRLIEGIAAEDVLIEAYRRGLFHIKPGEEAPHERD